jgi:hypothetical protein
MKTDIDEARAAQVRASQCAERARALAAGIDSLETAVDATQKHRAGAAG